MGVLYLRHVYTCIDGFWLGGDFQFLLPPITVTSEINPILHCNKVPLSKYTM